MARKAPKVKMGRPSRESAKIANEMLDSQTELLGVLDNINPKLKEALNLEEKISDVMESHLNSKKTGLKVGEDIGKTVTEEMKMTSKLVGYTDDQLQGVYGIAGGMKKAGKNAKAFARVLLMNPALALLAALIAIGKILFQAVKDANELREDIGGSAMQALKFSQHLKAAQFAGKLLMLDAEEIKNAFTGLVDAFGELNNRTAITALNVARTSRELGISVDNTIDLMSVLKAVNGETNNMALNTLQSLANTEALKGMAPTALFKELAQHSKHFASYTGDSQKNLVKAVLQAKKLNTEFDGLVGLGDELLDVSERIQKEQLLSAMLGRQIDLERFMALGVQDDLVGQQREFARIFADFGKQNATMQRMIASALNMTTDEIMKWGSLQYDEARKTSRATQGIDRNTQG